MDMERYPEYTEKSKNQKKSITRSHTISVMHYNQLQKTDTHTSKKRKKKIIAI